MKGSFPIPFQMGKHFRDMRAFLDKSEYWSKDQFKEYQESELRGLIAHVYKNVPYYRKIFNERNLKPGDIQTQDDLSKLPYLTKDNVSEYFKDLLATNIPHSELETITTGGTTTGVASEFCRHRKVTEPAYMAFVWRGWNWVGVHYGDRWVSLRGQLLHQSPKAKNRWMKWNPLTRSLNFSSFEMNDETLPEYIRHIRNYGPKVFQAHPSSAYIVAKYLEDNNERMNGIKAVITSSETLHDHQRSCIEEQLGAKIYDMYGNLERTVLVMQCENDSYHIIPEMGMTELINNRGEPAGPGDNSAHIIATSFINYAMPLIRYQTCDVVNLTSNQSCDCGRNMPLITGIHGRMQDFFVTTRNSLVPLTGGTEGKVFNCASDVLKKAQFYQDTAGKVILNLVVKEGYNEGHSKKIIEALNHRYGREIEFITNTVDDIPRTKKEAKWKMIDQKLEINLSAFGDPDAGNTPGNQ